LSGGNYFLIFIIAQVPQQASVELLTATFFIAALCTADVHITPIMAPCRLGNAYIDRCPDAHPDPLPDSIPMADIGYPRQWLRLEPPVYTGWLQYGFEETTE